MSNRYKRYTKQFKKDAVAYVRNHSDLSVNAAAINFGVAPSTLRPVHGKMPVLNLFMH